MLAYIADDEAYHMRYMAVGQLCHKLDHKRNRAAEIRANTGKEAFRLSVEHAKCDAM